MFIVARIKPAPGNRVAGFLIRTAIRIHGRIHPASALPQDASPRVAIRTSQSVFQRKPAPDVIRGGYGSRKESAPRPGSHGPQNNERSQRGQHDGLPDIAFPNGAWSRSQYGRRCRERGNHSIHFTAQSQTRARAFSAGCLRSTRWPNDVTMDHTDTAPCQFLPSFDLPGPDLKNG
jgi:hypothetical protein